MNWVVLLALLLSPLFAAPVVAASASQPAAVDLAIRAEADGVLLDLKLPPYRMVELIHEGTAYQQIVVDGDQWQPGGQPGAPSLPERGADVGGAPQRRGDGAGAGCAAPDPGRRLASGPQAHRRAGRG
ncbi:MAG: hypothetical protein V9H69_09875 [Anaerolineae bacterium]